MTGKFKLDDRFAIGKYGGTGYTIGEILTIDPGYIDWCMANWKDAEWDDEVIYELSRQLDRKGR